MKMRAMYIGLAIWSAAALPACGGDGPENGEAVAGAEGGEDGAPSGRSLFAMSIHSLVGVDTGSHEETLWTRVTQEQTDIRDMHVTDELIWLAREDGVIVVVDRVTEEVVAEVDMEPLNEVEGEYVTTDVVTAGNGFGYTAAMASGNHAVVRIDDTTFEMTAQSDILSQSSYVSGIVYDGSHLWVTESSVGDLFKLDPTTLEAVDSVPLHQVPVPTEREVGGFGTGGSQLLALGDYIWALDAERVRLLRVDKQTLETTVANELSEVAHLDSYVEFTTNGRDLFLMISANDTVLRFDGISGEQLAQYEFADKGGVATMALDDNHLYMQNGEFSPATVYDIDVDTGATLQTMELGRTEFPMAVD